MNPTPLDRFLTARLAERSDLTIRRWLDQLEERLRVRPRHVFPTRELLDHMPRVVEHIALSLRHERRAHMGDELVRHLRELARLRHEQGYDVQEVLRELEVLGAILYEELSDALVAWREDDDGAARQAAESDAGDIVEIARRLHRGLAVTATVIAGSFREAEAEERRESAAQLTMFTRTLAHELKNPLGAAQGAVELLQEERVRTEPEQRKRFLELIARNIRRASELVDDVRALTRVQPREGDEEVRLRPLDQVLQRVLEEVRGAAEEQDIRIEVAEPVPDADVEAIRVEVALMNLLMNAVKYCDPEKPTSWVKVAIEPQEESWCVVVSDNGLGIPAEQHPRVFERFFRAHEDVAEGSGLGLAITREAIEQIGGAAGFRSSPGEGSTFYFTIPREQGATVPQRLADDR